MDVVRTGSSSQVGGLRHGRRIRGGARRGYLLVVAGAAEQEPEQQAEPEEHGGRDED
jgi:hypothetical protein